MAQGIDRCPGHRLLHRRGSRPTPGHRPRSRPGRSTGRAPAPGTAQRRHHGCPRRHSRNSGKNSGAAAQRRGAPDRWPDHRKRFAHRPISATGPAGGFQGVWHPDRTGDRTIRPEAQHHALATEHFFPRSGLGGSAPFRRGHYAKHAGANQHLSQAPGRRSAGAAAGHQGIHARRFQKRDGRGDNAEARQEKGFRPVRKIRFGGASGSGVTRQSRAKNSR